MESTLTQDTRTVLLLCGTFVRRDGNGPEPLGPRQYNALEERLKTEGLSPGYLLTSEGQAWLAEFQILEVEPVRVEALLERGAALDQAIERWENNGLWVISRCDQCYPARLKDYLGQAAPRLLYGIGAKDRLNRGGLAVVGSRDRSDKDGKYARRIGEQCASEEITVVSGAAKGIDLDAMNGALEANGWALGVLSEGLARIAVSGECQSYIESGRLTLVSPYDPDSTWKVYNAMERNKVLYGLSNAALVVASAADTGGTWAGATEAIKARRINVYVKSTGTMAPGNSKLIENSGLPFPGEPWESLRPLLTAPTEAEPDAGPIRDAYTLVIEEILSVLREPRKESFLATAMNVRGPQIKDWLDRAVSEDRVTKTKNPVRYQVAHGSLFNR